MNEKLFVRNPEQTELGRKIIEFSIKLIYENGFEAFTFKKLAEVIGSTEAGIYRYFEKQLKCVLVQKCLVVMQYAYNITLNSICS